MRTQTQTDAEEKLEATKLELRNYERRLWNAEHTYRANKGELTEMIRAGEGGGRITRQEDCCKFWQNEIDKFNGKIFLHCLKTGLNNDRYWTY